jgi:spoIIIJ-associated protein
VSNESKENAMAEGVTLQEQAAVAKEFLEGLVTTMGLSATVEIRELSEDTVELAVDGDDLGMLVGPKGSTLAAVQDITRTVVQGRFSAKTDRILVDIARYRERRAAALTRFTQEVAADVIENAEERALEAMSPADRKVVHDAANDIDGIATRSEGEEPNRYVVLLPNAG